MTQAKTKQQIIEEVLKEIANKGIPNSIEGIDNRWGYELKEAISLTYNKARQQTADDFIRDMKPLIILLDRIDRGDYFIEDDKELQWRKCLEELKKKYKNGGKQK